MCACIPERERGRSEFGHFAEERGGGFDIDPCTHTCSTSPLHSSIIHTHTHLFIFRIPSSLKRAEVCERRGRASGWGGVFGRLSDDSVPFIFARRVACAA